MSRGARTIVLDPEYRASLRAQRLDARMVRAVDVPRAVRACPCCGELWVGGRCGRRRTDAVVAAPLPSVVLARRALGWP